MVLFLLHKIHAIRRILYIIIYLCEVICSKVGATLKGDEVVCKVVHRIHEAIRILSRTYYELNDECYY